MTCDVGLKGTGKGSLALSACAVNDLFGWFLITVVLSIATTAEFEATEIVWTALGVIFVPGGAMEIVVGTLALELELQLITETVFVAIVFAALVSSIAVGPLISWRVRSREDASKKPPQDDESAAASV